MHPRERLGHVDLAGSAVEALGPAGPEADGTQMPDTSLDSRLVNGENEICKGIGPTPAPVQLEAGRLNADLFCGMGTLLCACRS